MIDKTAGDYWTKNELNPNDLIPHENGQTCLHTSFYTLLFPKDKSNRCWVLNRNYGLLGTLSCDEGQELLDKYACYQVQSWSDYPFDSKEWEAYWFDVDEADND